MIIDDMERDGFVFYRSFYEAVQDIEDEHTRLLALEAIINYGVLGEELPLPKGMASIVFKLVKPQLEANNERYLYDNGTGAKDDQIARYIRAYMVYLYGPTWSEKGQIYRKVKE